MRNSANNIVILMAVGLMAGGVGALSPAYADSPTEVPDNAVENYLSEDLKTVPDGVYIPYPEEAEEFRNSPLFKFFEKLGPKTQTKPPSGGGCKVDKKFLESV